MVENGGFETGSFSPWINQGGTSYNEIVSDRVYSGSYALYMDTHVSSAPYEPVYQEISTSISLDEAPIFTAAVYPTKVGNTAGEAGVDYFTIRIRNTATEEEHNVFYLWSGYTYPGGALNVNVTKVMYLLFDMIPNQWNILERNLLNDYIEFFGAPADVSDLVVNKVTILAHTSNGDPGNFWVDDISFNYDTTTTSSNSDTTTTSETPTTADTETPTPPPDDFGWVTLVITGGSGGVIIIVIIVIILERRGSSGESIPSGYNW